MFRAFTIDQYTMMSHLMLRLWVSSLCHLLMCKANDYDEEVYMQVWRWFGELSDIPRPSKHESK